MTVDGLGRSISSCFDAYDCLDISISIVDSVYFESSIFLPKHSFRYLSVFILYVYPLWTQRKEHCSETIQRQYCTTVCSSVLIDINNEEGKEKKVRHEMRDSPPTGSRRFLSCLSGSSLARYQQSVTVMKTEREKKKKAL